MATVKKAHSPSLEPARVHAMQSSVPLVSVTLEWATARGEQLLLEIARVSSTNPKSGDTRLISYLIKHKHWSPFEMVNMCVSIECPRDISRQLLRHRSFSFQEFSQRYQQLSVLQQEALPREARQQHPKNRQLSTPDLPAETTDEFERARDRVWRVCFEEYTKALEAGVAKECARVFLPEGLTRTKVVVNGTLRSWIHYCQLRDGNGTQHEHRLVAREVKKVFKAQFPTVFEAAFGETPE